MAVAGDSDYLRVEQRNENEHLHKHATVAKNPYPTFGVAGKTFVTQREDSSLKEANFNCVLKALIPRMT